MARGLAQVESQSVVRFEEDRPLLESAASEGAGDDGLFAALEAMMPEAATVRLLNAA